MINQTNLDGTDIFLSKLEFANMFEGFQNKKPNLQIENESNEFLILPSQLEFDFP